MAPTPQLAWSQVVSRGEKRAAAKTLIPASIAPAPRPPTRPASRTTPQPGATAYSSALDAVAALLAARSRPTPSRATRVPLAKLDAR